MTTLRRQLNEFQGQEVQRLREEQQRATELQTQLITNGKEIRLMREQLNEFHGH